VKVNNFNEDLKFSEQAGHEDFWQVIYKKAFPDIVFAQICTGKCAGQYLGIDRVIQLKSGKTLYIDEKKRRTEYNDIALEFISNDQTNTRGWIEKDLLIDYLAYAFISSKRCYLFPWHLLIRAWNHYKADWHKKYRLIEAQNPGYKTLSRAIPINILLSSVRNASIIEL